MTDSADRPPTVVFLHVGPEVKLPGAMVRSVRRQNPGARIIQCADQAAPEIEGVDEVRRTPRSNRNLMLFRMQAFATIPTPGPTWFIDTDMICNRPLAFEGGAPPEAAVCRREFELDTRVNPSPGGGIDLSEYRGRTMGEVWPYVGCATLLENSSFWATCLAEYEKLDPKFFQWFGDQEAIRNVVDSGRHAVAFLPESHYACLPEQARGLRPVITHYKGSRKAMMLERAQREGLL